MKLSEILTKENAATLVAGMQNGKSLFDAAKDSLDIQTSDRLAVYRIRTNETPQEVVTEIMKIASF